MEEFSRYYIKMQLALLQNDKMKAARNLDIAVRYGATVFDEVIMSDLHKVLFAQQLEAGQYTVALSTFENLKDHLFLDADDPLNESYQSILDMLAQERPISYRAEIFDTCTRCAEAKPQWQQIIHGDSFIIDDIDGALESVYLMCNTN